ncbi:MAG: hypothetical protein ACK2UX_18965, partial [Anaerolineae bacterium]
MLRKKWALLSTLLVVGALVLAACQPQTVIVEKEVTKEVVKEVTKEVEVTKVVKEEVTKVVTQEVQVEVTPTPTPVPVGGFLNLTSFADADILNPFMSSDSSSAEIEGYIWDSGFETDPWTGETIPGLVESWDVTDGNKT